MSRRKYRYWSKEEKYRIIRRLFDEELGVRELCREESITTTLIYKWKAAFLEHGIEGLENSIKPRNPLVKFQNRKNLTELEQLQYENMKLKIENSRLKKGYTNEEVIAIRQKKSSKKNMG
jgi:transposase-like protein